MREGERREGERKGGRKKEREKERERGRDQREVQRGHPFRVALLHGGPLRGQRLNQPRQVVPCRPAENAIRWLESARSMA
jgi:hypothetical protein